jgi:Pentapeptide repeats (9 copies)
MSFTRIDLLPNFDSKERQQVRERWEDYTGRALFERIIALIREGAGEDFLQYKFGSGELGFLRDYWDLAGIQIFGEDIVFPEGDNFENIDFSYAQFWHSTFTTACLPQTHFSFARLYNVKFKNCLFALAHFYGCKFEKCSFENCSFVEGNGFTNCDFQETTFSDCFFSENIFKSCRFDENVHVVNTTKPLVLGLMPCATNFKRTIFRVSTKASRMDTSRERYSIEPENISLSNVRPILDSTAPKKSAAIFWNALLLSAGAILTFGAKADLLGTLPLLDQVVYIASAFLGISLVTLFITVLASVLLKDK